MLLQVQNSVHAFDQSVVYAFFRVLHKHLVCLQVQEQIFCRLSGTMLPEALEGVGGLAQKATDEAYAIFKAYRRKEDVRKTFAKYAVLSHSFNTKHAIRHVELSLSG